MHPLVIGIRYSIGMANSDYHITEAQRKALGVAIHEAMTLRGMNQVELAEALGTTQSVISQWRYGKFLCPPRAVFAMEEALAVPPGFLSHHFDYRPLGSAVIAGAPEIEVAVLDSDLGGGQKAAVLAIISEFQKLNRESSEASKPPRTRKAQPKPAARAAAKPRTKVKAATKPATKPAASRRRSTKSTDPAV